MSRVAATEMGPTPAISQVSPGRVWPRSRAVWSTSTMTLTLLPPGSLAGSGTVRSGSQGGDQVGGDPVTGERGGAGGAGGGGGGGWAGPDVRSGEGTGATST